VKPGQVIPMRVVHLATVMEYIVVTPFIAEESARDCKERYYKGQRVYGLLKFLAEEHTCPLQELYQKFVYTISLLDTAWDSFAWLAELEPKEQLKKAASEYGEDIGDCPIFHSLMARVKSMDLSRQVQVVCLINVTCHNDLGVRAIREALLEGKKIYQDSKVRESLLV
jgi:translation initiation factor 2 alpha subunit (eIF-2alpha)